MIQHITKPFKYFFKLEAASGLVLLFAAILALIISNGSLSELYFSTLEKYITLGVKDFGLKLSVLHWINDVLMAIFSNYKLLLQYTIPTIQMICITRGIILKTNQS